MLWQLQSMTQSGNSFVSQALDDNKVSDNEFKLIASEMQKYRQIKESLRSKPRKKKQFEPASGDLEKLKQDIRTEVGEEYRQKIISLDSESK